MNVGELKQLIADLPDDMLVMEAHDGNVRASVTETNLTVETVYEHSFKNRWGITDYHRWISDIDWIVPEPKIEYKALVITTYD